MKLGVGAKQKLHTAAKLPNTKKQMFQPGNGYTCRFK